MSTRPRTSVTPRSAAAVINVIASSPFADYEKIRAQAIRKTGDAENSIASTAEAPIDEEIRQSAVRPDDQDGDIA